MLSEEVVGPTQYCPCLNLLLLVCCSLFVVDEDVVCADELTASEDLLDKVLAVTDEMGLFPFEDEEDVPAVNNEEISV